MSVTVNTKEELKAAVERKEPSIFIADPDLAAKVKKIKSAKKLSKWSIGIVLAGAAVGGAGLALAPATGGATAGVGGAAFSIAIGTAAAAGGMSIGVAIAIAALLILGIVVIFAIWKDYDIRIGKIGPSGVEGIELIRRA